MTLVRLGRAAQITLPSDILKATHVEEGGYFEAEVTEAGMILLTPVGIGRQEPTAEQEAEILAAVDEARIYHTGQRRR